MNVIDSLLDKVKQFNESLADGTYLSRIILDHEAEICDMNTESQLFERGVNRVGVEIMDYAPYHPYTIELKELKGQPTNRVTLRDEGDFHRSFKVQTYPDKFLIYATDGKTEWLMKKYGRQIIGLTDENAEELAQSYIKPELVDKAWEVIMN